ncbi:MAG TPA: hypothetical protein VMG74_00380 [Gaiellaceae bacterium]|nr:hypothetical protein [Gaiellaceae bacterium]
MSSARSVARLRRRSIEAAGGHEHRLGELLGFSSGPLDLRLDEFSGTATLHS